MQRTVSACDCGGVCPVRAASAAIRAGMSPGGRNVGPSTSTTVVSAGTRAAAASRSGRSAGSPASFQVRIDSWSTHRPMTLRRYRTVPSTPASLVKLAARLASVSTGWSSSSPTSDHVPQEMYAKSSPTAGTATTADAVSCEPTVHTGTDPCSPTSARTWPSSAPGVEQRREQALLSMPEPLREVASPTSACVASSSPVVDALVTSATRAPVSQ